MFPKLIDGFNHAFQMKILKEVVSSVVSYKLKLGEVYMRHFDLEMNDLKKRLVDMAEIVQQMIKFSVDMIVKRDLAMSKEVFNREREANLTEIVVDDTCLKLL